MATPSERAPLCGISVNTITFQRAVSSVFVGATGGLEINRLAHL